MNTLFNSDESIVRNPNNGKAIIKTIYNGKPVRYHDYKNLFHHDKNKLNDFINVVPRNEEFNILIESPNTFYLDNKFAYYLNYIKMIIKKFPPRDSLKYNEFECHIAKSKFNHDNTHALPGLIYGNPEYFIQGAKWKLYCNGADTRLELYSCNYSDWNISIVILQDIYFLSSHFNKFNNLNDAKSFFDEIHNIVKINNENNLHSFTSEVNKYAEL